MVARKHCSDRGWDRPMLRLSSFTGVSCVPHKKPLRKVFVQIHDSPIVVGLIHQSRSQADCGSSPSLIFNWNIER